VENLKSFKNELQNIVFGNDGKGEGNLIKTVQAYLKSDTNAGANVKSKFRSKPEEERTLKEKGFCL
jgi:hypothetical protein